MADTSSADSWAGMAPFVASVFASQNQTGSGNTGSSMENIAKGLLNSKSSQPKHQQIGVVPPGLQKDLIGAPGVGILGPGGVVPPVVMGGAPQTPIVAPQQIGMPAGLTGAPAMAMPSKTPITGPASVPQTSNPFVTGTPNPSGSQVS
jgi:hypothetical protein